MVFERYREIIPDFEAFQNSLLHPLPTHVRVNRLKIEPEKLIERFIQKKIGPIQPLEGMNALLTIPGLDSPGNLLEYFLGMIHPQALTSCLAAIVLNPEPEALTLDLCASPGGKTAHMAALMENRGLIVANELHAGRHAPLLNTLERLGILNTVVTEYQAQEFPMKNRYDFVLADVPCTGEGRFRKNTVQKRPGKAKGRARLVEIQKRIIIRGFDLLAEGGVMVYATCTYSPEENESVVDCLLKQRNADLLPVEIQVPYEPGIPRWKGEVYDRRMGRAVRFYPHQIDSVGFFLARIGRA